MRIGAMRWLTIGLAFGTLLAACGENGEGTSSAQGSPSVKSPAAEESPAADAEMATVKVAESDLGSILVDAEGITLYLFEADSDGASTCYDECADTWPALTGEAPIAGEGIEESLLSTTERDDGQVQVTYADHPLYYFASDRQAGDTEGQGVGDIWYVVDPAGAAVTSKARTAPGY